MNNWIKVEEQKPEPGVDVIVFVGTPAAPSGLFDIGFLDDDGEWITLKHRGRIEYWMPLPDPPEE